MSPRLGRPPKFGRPSQLVAMTLPVDVVEWLRTIDADPGWAIVSLHEQHERGEKGTFSDARGERLLVELVSIGHRHSLIVVDRRALRALQGVAVIPISDTRALLALDPGRGLADLELAVVDRLDESLDTSERAVLAELRAALRAWRTGGRYRFHLRSIIVADEIGHRPRKSARAEDPVSATAGDRSRRRAPTP